MVSLPPEILLNVVSQVSDEYREMAFDSAKDEIAVMKRTLMNLCLSSKIFYTVAQPVLHRIFSNSNELDEYTDEDRLPRKTGSRTYRQTTRTENFIRTLIQRPDLADGVEDIKLEDFQNNDVPCDFDTTMLPFDPLLGDLFMGASMVVPRPSPGLVRQWLGDEEDGRRIQEWQDDWRDELQTGGRNAQIALLFILTPNLVRLEMESSKRGFGPCVDDLWEQMLGPRSERTVICHGVNLGVDAQLRSQAPTPPTIFSSLEDLIVTSKPNGDGVVLKSVKRLLPLPSLRLFYGINLEERGGLDSMRLYYRLPLMHLEYLQLEECTIDDMVLRTLIEACPNLKNLDPASPM
ncbi:glycoside hydrolase, partial [Aureobasidium melanogenum]